MSARTVRPAALLVALLLAASGAAGTAGAGESASSGSGRAGGGEDHKLYVGAGMLVFEGGRYVNKDSGATGYSAIVLPELSASSRLRLAGDWRIVPLFSLTPIGHKSPDGGETTIVIRLDGRVAYTVAGLIDLQAGLGLADAYMSGSGGTIELKNGNGTSTFGFPSKSSSSYLFYWEAGVGADLLKPVRIDADAFVTGAFVSRRVFNFSVQLSYGVL